MKRTIEKPLDARVLSHFVQTATKFNSDLWLTTKVDGEEQTANAKSLMNIIALDLTQGMTVTLTAKGEDAAQALQALAQYL